MLFESVDVVTRPRDVRVKKRRAERGCRNPRTTILRLFALRLVAAFQTKNAELLPPIPLHCSLPDKQHLLRGVEFMALFIQRINFHSALAGFFCSFALLAFFLAPFWRAKGAKKAWPNDNDICLHLFWVFNVHVLQTELPPAPPLHDSSGCRRYTAAQCVYFSLSVSLPPLLSVSSARPSLTRHKQKIKQTFAWLVQSSQFT